MVHARSTGQGQVVDDRRNPGGYRPLETFDEDPLDCAVQWDVSNILVNTSIGMCLQTLQYPGGTKNDIISISRQAYTQLEIVA